MTAHRTEADRVRLFLGCLCPGRIPSDLLEALTDGAPCRVYFGEGGAAITYDDGSRLVLTAEQVPA